MTTKPDPVEKAKERRAVLERIVTQLQAGKVRRLAAMVPDWTDAEKAQLMPFAERIKAGEISRYKASKDLQKILPNRSFEAIRKKLKNWLLYGVFN